ncbi:DNA-directed RNA polymerase sigma-70 factor [Haloferula helveola]|uniref:DNA-directed RNA polymerase sigma-70 factor n=1 Tax=Haloferula helveola TaxID=490095 RepID=A0ABM7R9A0_9BACT|nr:DNA-directed RNA polymerase sigma-70 factor [Haloferula helveola]
MTPEQEEQFVHLIADHQGVIRSFIISLLPGAPGVDDVIQETNSVIWRKRDSFELGTCFKSWALTVARFQAMSYRTSLRTRRWVTLDENAAELVADEMEDLLSKPGEEGRLAALHCCIGKLKDKERELIQHRYWHKTRLQDFAVSTGHSVGVLKVQLFRIRAALKKCIERELGSDDGPVAT